MAAKKQEHTSLLFELDSGSVAVSVSHFEQGVHHPVSESFSTRAMLDHTESFEQFFAHALKKLDDIAHKALKHTSSVDSIYVSVSAPWMSSQKRVVQHTDKKGFIVTEKLLAKLIAKELDHPLSKNLDFHKHHHELEIFERRTVDIYVNGYPTLNAVSPKKVHDVAIHSLTSVMTQTTKRALEHVIERVFHRTPKLISNTFVLYHTLKTKVPDINNAMILDVGGTHTEVFVIRDDHLKDIARFPKGASQLKEDLANILDVQRIKAQSLMSLYTKEVLSDEYSREINAAMEHVYRSWLKSWYEVCDVLSAKKLLPSTICLITPPYLSSWLRFHILQSDEISEHLHVSDRINIIDLPQYLNLSLKEQANIKVQDQEILPFACVVSHLISYE